MLQKEIEMVSTAASWAFKLGLTGRCHQLVELPTGFQWLNGTAPAGKFFRTTYRRVSD
jgi:hypothetical protein